MNYQTPKDQLAGMEAQEGKAVRLEFTLRYLAAMYENSLIKSLAQQAITGDMTWFDKQDERLAKRIIKEMTHDPATDNRITEAADPTITYRAPISQD